MEKKSLSKVLKSNMLSKKESVRSLSKKVHLSPTIIQGLRSGIQNDIKLSNFLSIFEIFGYKLYLEKGEEKIHIKPLLASKTNNTQQSS